MASKVFKVFITRSILKDGQDFLERAGHIVEVHPSNRPMNYSELLLKASQFDALITMLDDKIDSEFLQKNAHLKVISNYAVGFNNIDIETASKLGILIGNTPDVLTEATAEVALGLLLATSRNFLSSHLWAKNGGWTGWEATANLGSSLRGKKLGILGFGRIGQRLAEMAYYALKMDILYFSSSPKNVNLPAQKIDLQELLESCDYISIHLPLNQKTHHLIDREKLNLMKSNAVLINTARGEIIKSSDLIDHLKKNAEFKVGLDVTEPEPLEPSSEFYQLSNVLILPHIGSASYEARRAMSVLAAQNVHAGLTGDSLVGWVNKKNLHP